MKDRIFVTDGHWRKSLAAVRALGSAGLSVTVGESTRIAAAAFSRYCSRALVYPSPFFCPSDFMGFLLKELSERPYRMLLPMEDETLEHLSLHREAFSRLTYLPIVSHEKLTQVRRKDHVLEVAEHLGIPVPRTWVIQDLSELDRIKDQIPYPAVIKPTVGSGAVGVRYPEDAHALVREYRAVHRAFPFPMIQERIPRNGTGFGASFLMDEKGRVKASFVHKRLREYPVSGGASTLRESVRRDDIRDMGRALLEALGWFGVAMVEFKLDPRDNKPKLMEVNPRFWGSLALAVVSGVNFPYLLYRLARGEDFAPVEDYQVGKRCRWMLPGDILHFIHSPRRGSLVPQFFRLWDRNTAHDILSLRDPMPVLGTFLTLLTLLYDPDMRHRMKKRHT
jgi:predicted ATP-grasp superfamily ATP-dependent carboligase